MLYSQVVKHRARRHFLKCSAWIGLGLLLAFALGRRFTQSPSTPEVIYEGRSVSAWALDLISPSAATRKTATETIAQLNSNAVPALVRLLRTPDPVLARAARAVSWRLPNRHRGGIVRLLNPFEAPANRTAAAQALLIMSPHAQSALPALSNAVHWDGTASWHAALALARLGEPGTAALVAALSNAPPAQRGYVCYALSTKGEAASNAIPALLRVLQTDTPEVAEKAAQALSNMRSLAVPELASTLEHPNVQVRISAIRALSAMGPAARDALPQLLQQARAQPAAIRAAAVEALAQVRLSDPRVVTALAESLADTDLAVRLKALQGLRRLPEPARRAKTALLGALADDNPVIRAQTAALLGEAKAEFDWIMPALHQVVRNDDNELARASAKEALAKLRLKSGLREEVVDQKELTEAKD